LWNLLYRFVNYFKNEGPDPHVFGLEREKRWEN
jgi:hypothetical protein